MVKFAPFDCTVLLPDDRKIEVENLWSYAIEDGRLILSRKTDDKPLTEVQGREIKPPMYSTRRVAMFNLWIGFIIHEPK